MKNGVMNVLIVGVGGQGVILASEILAQVAVNSGHDVKKSEVHGMAQRGGVVSSHVRFGKKVYSPLIPRGQADVVLAFEEAEALRWAYYIKENGRLIVNRQKIVPPIVATKKGSYPEDPVGQLKKAGNNVLAIDAISIAKDLGNTRLVNTLLLGALSSFLSLKDEEWGRIIRVRVPKGTEGANLNAFEKGREVAWV